MTARVAIGIGCRRGCPGDAIAALIREAAGADLAGASLFTIDRKADDPGMRDAADALGLPLVFLPAGDLAAVTDRVLTASARVKEAVGVSSVAEAAALAGAGREGVLTGPRLARDGATCAVAIVPEPVP